MFTIEESKIDSAITSSFLKNETQFRKCVTNIQRINFFLNEENSIEVREPAKCSKNNEKSTELRNQGNSLFKSKKYFSALRFYTTSIAWAKTKTIASLAYSNRSMILLKLGLNDECLIDIERALDGCSAELKTKLVSRRNEVRQKQKTESEKKPVIPAIPTSSIIEIQNNKNYGRHVIATRDIEIGELLVVEKPFTATLQRNYYDYCHECLTKCQNLVPCDTCTGILFCGETCKMKALNNYHKYECLYDLDSIGTLLLPEKYLSFALKTTLKMRNEDLNEKKMKLLTHTNKRPLLNLYIFSWISSEVFKFLKKRTEMFTDFPNFETTFKELFLYTLQIIDVNSIKISRLEPKLTQNESVSYGYALYLICSCFNHSCYPNTFFYHEGSTIFVRALSTVRKDEQCFFSYSFTYNTELKQVRREILQDKYYFTCKCQACAQNWKQEEENEDFEEPHALIQVAILQNNKESLKEIAPVFIKRLKSIEMGAPLGAISCLRQLVVDCYSHYEAPKKNYLKS